MALVACKGCAENISPKAEACPKCGHPNDKAKHLSGASVFLILIGTVFFIWWIAVGAQKEASTQMAKVERQVASDMVEQYEMAKRSGDPMQTCAQAGLVTAAYLQANDESNYRTWQAKQKVDCEKAGVPM